jgi:nucleotide-binding universal stress UspA family protein
MQAAVIPIIPQIQLKRVLLATDLSETHCAPLPIVSTIARRYHSEVLIAHIWSPSSFSVTSAPDALRMLESKEEEEIREKMSRFVRRPELAGLPAEGVVERGAPAEKLRCIVNERSVGLVVVNTHGRTGLKRFLMGSTAEDLFRHLNCPVLTVGPHIAQRFCWQKEIKSILYPTDLSDASQAIFPYLASLAHEYRAAIKILHVLPLESRKTPEMSTLAESLRRKMECMFASQLSPGSSAQFVIDAGDTVERILSHAGGDRSDLIGLGVRKAPEIRTHFTGTIAYRLAVWAECPVLTARSGASV